MRESMQRAVALSGLVVAVAAMSAIGVLATDEDAWSVVNDLDRLVQRRFAETDQRLGMVRLATTAHQRYEFVPENDSERGVIGRLETRNLQVVMYLAGWRRPRVPSPFSLSPQGTIPPLLQGPVLVHPRPAHRGSRRSEGVASGLASISDIPDQARLEREAVDALLTFRQDDSKSFQVGSWKFVARPVRASGTACLNCHNWRPTDGSRSTAETSVEPFRLGDPLGAVLYGVRPLPMP